MVIAILAGVERDGIHVIAYQDDGEPVECVIRWEQILAMLAVLNGN